MEYKTLQPDNSGSAFDRIGVYCLWRKTLTAEKSALLNLYTQSAKNTAPKSSIMKSPLVSLVLVSGLSVLHRPNCNGQRLVHLQGADDEGNDKRSRSEGQEQQRQEWPQQTQKVQAEQRGGNSNGRRNETWVSFCTGCRWRLRLAEWVHCGPMT